MSCSASGSILRSPLLERCGWVRHGYTTRIAPDGDVFDMRLRNGGMRHRATACALMGIDAERLRFLHQVHGCEALVVDAATPPGRPSGAADALITAARGVPLAVTVADCAPILLVDPVAPAAAAVHSGWRGTLADIAGQVVRRMQVATGTRPQDCLAWVGPSIGAAAFEVGEEVAAPFERAYGPRWVNRAGAKPTIDLKGLIRWQLQRAGLLPDNIDVSPLCTRSDPSLCSYRRDGPGTPQAMAALQLV